MSLNSSSLIILQLFLDVVLIGLFFLVYMRLRSLRPQRIEAFLKALKESEELTEKLNKLIEEKKTLVQDLEQILNPRVTTNGSVKDCEPTLQADQLIHSKVISLWKQGKNNKEISKETGLSLGEIEVIISIFKNKS